MRIVTALATVLVLAVASACGGDGRAAPSDRSAGDRAGAGGAAAAAAEEGRPSGQESPLRSPESEAMNARAPDVFRAVLHTTEGPVTVEVRRDWAPRGADRFYNLARHGFFEDARFFRVIEGFVAQFGLSGRPELDRLWRRHPIPDDSVRRSNERGTLTFASAGEDTRTTQLFVNLADNERLDGMGFAPIGRVVDGMAAVDSLYAGYGDGPPRGNGPSQQEILERGNEYLEAEFPELDRIESVEVREGAGESGEG